MDARDGDRQGLPLAVATEILFLARTNKIIRAIDLAQKLSMSVEEAYRLVDEGDQARLKIDVLDDPLVSRDTITRVNHSTQKLARHSAAPSAGSQAQGLGELLLMLIRSKWLVWGIIAVLSAKFFWPLVKKLS